jgi:uncharacterized spore protein YtfJ
MSATEMRSAEAPATGISETFLERLAERLGGLARADTVYGAPVERDGVTVIPVAKAMLGLGGGRGSDSGEGSSGGGGGMRLTPAGFIEVKDGGSRFRAIRDLTTLLPAVAAVILAYGAFVFLVLRGVAALKRARQRQDRQRRACLALQSGAPGLGGALPLAWVRRWHTLGCAGPLLPDQRKLQVPFTGALPFFSRP